MGTTNASQTAALVAAYRARSTAVDGICSDEWAARLAGPEGEKLAARLDALSPHMELWVSARARHLDDVVRRLTAPQVVILGAGFDTRAARLATPGRRFFEVDVASTARAKQTRLASLKGYPADAATYVTCDFENENFLTRLEDAGFDANEPAVFVWEGVTYYLTEPAVRATLERVASCHPKTTLLFDFVGRRFISGQSKSAADAGMLQLVRDLGEPMVWGIDDVLPLLFKSGFRRVRVDSFDEIVLRLTSTYDRRRCFRFQYVAETSIETDT